MNEPLKLLIPGEPISEVLESLKRITRRAKTRALVAQRRFLRLGTPVTEKGWLLAAQEYYYAAALCGDFTEALAQALAEKSAESSAKNNSLN